MTRGSPSLDRAFEVLTVLGATPEHGFTLAEIVRQTDVPKATCHALLTSLVEARWVLRHPAGPSYRLGPGLIALGEAARRGYPELPFAQDQMRALGTELGLECLASAVVDSEIVILGKSGVPAPMAVTAALGQRVPAVPPLATIFFAWSDESTIAAALGGPVSDTYRKALKAVRERGYSVGQENPVRERLGRSLVSQLSRGQLTGPELGQLVKALADEDYQLVDVNESARYWLSHLAAPVFDAAGRVSLALTLVGFSSPMELRDIHRHGERLRVAADAVTAAVHGMAPDSVGSQSVRSDARLEEAHR